MATDDYYDLIGVAADADRDEIRDAYRARRAELTDDERGRATAAQLNRAWNVLSDAQQRARYDDRLAAARDTGDDVIVPEVVEAATTNGGGRRRRPARASASRSGSARQPRSRVELVDEINDVPLASIRDRTTALVIDGFIVFLLLFMGTQLLFFTLANREKPAVVDRVDQLRTARDDQAKVVSAAQKDRNAIKDKNSAPYKAADAKLTTEKNKLKVADDGLSTEQRKLRGVQVQAVAIAAVASLIVFAVPTALTGKSPGKALRKIRLMKQDAVTPAGWATSFVHYGITIGFLAVTLLTFPLAAVIVVFGVSSYGRNRLRQGWDNRLSKTVVIAG